MMSLFVSFLVICVGVHSVGENPVKLKYKNDFIVRLFPQGWAFFTKEISRYRFSIYNIEKGGVISKINTNNSNVHYLFGLKKTNRLLPYYIEGNFNRMKESFWFQSELSLDSIDIDRLNLYELKDLDTSNNYLRGLYLIQMYEVTPWVYFSNDIVFSNKKYYIKIYIK